ncbi:hypothetical protein I0C86_28370 [Plantactinospora sp. S1510]|uniref:Uncharacterized protein n=1 Tax=Plantactinospora alkalitolerans TaxID=2789879 RepID=A0ABS0H306_9ACTN|nr:hypothetical protein [Plantactinospora alkalitolerans]MBF9132843.1 hypothetical protein [Plantactinospora alkalitolerans]
MARSGSAAYRRVVTGVRAASSIANRIVLPTPPGVSVRDALLDLPLRRSRSATPSRRPRWPGYWPTTARASSGNAPPPLPGWKKFIQETDGEELTWDIAEEHGS